MVKASLETSTKTSISTNLSSNSSISTETDETIQAQRICTKTDHLLKTIMEAHLEEQASKYTKQRQDKKMG